MRFAHISNVSIADRVRLQQVRWRIFYSFRHAFGVMDKNWTQYLLAARMVSSRFPEFINTAEAKEDDRQEKELREVAAPVNGKDKDAGRKALARKRQQHGNVLNIRLPFLHMRHAMSGPCVAISESPAVYFSGQQFPPELLLRR